MVVNTVKAGEIPGRLLSLDVTLVNGMVMWLINIYAPVVLSDRQDSSCRCQDFALAMLYCWGTLIV